MDCILEPNNSFVFNNLTLSPPTIAGISIAVGGGNPLYIQAPMCMSKNGIFKAGKKMCCDLNFNCKNEQFIKWIEDLEEYCQRYIHKNSEQWFESALELHDVENYFTASLKSFKSGKQYILRTCVPTRLGGCILNIFDEDQNPVPIEDILNTTDIITILEVKGISCASRSFQLNFEIKQMLVVKPNKLFETCIISKKHLGNAAAIAADTAEPVALKDRASPVHECISPVAEIAEEVVEITEEKAAADDPPSLGENIEEFQLDFDNVGGDDSVDLKNRNDMYYELYDEAIRKAKMAKTVALAAYLDAKRIKNLYMLDDIESEDEGI